ncbi:MAG: recombinase family protein [Bacteroidales bacterium]|nr:recombinase family protein [Bacteroidales bacterium]
MENTTEKKNNVKVIALYRVSSKQQDYTRQQKDIERVLAIDEYTPDQVIAIGKKESGVLLSMDEREGIQEMKHYIETENVEAVYVHELSRLSRRVADTFAIRDYLQEKHVQLVCLNPNIKCFTDDWKINPTANMVFGVMASMAENEGILRKERLAGGKKIRKEKGLFAGGKVAFGYQMPDKHKPVEINPETAPIVERIFRMYVDEQKSTIVIGKQLHEEGIFNGCKTLHAYIHKVQDILRNKYYTGNEIYPLIISNIQFQQAQERMNQKTAKPRESYKNNVYIGKGLLYINNHPMQPRRDVGTYVYNVQGDERCFLNIDIADTLLLQLTDEFLHAPVISDNTSIIEGYKIKVAECQRMVANKQTHIEKLIANRDKLSIMELTDEISETAAKKARNDIKNEIKKTEADIITIESKIKDLENVINDMSEQQVIDVYGLDKKEQAEMAKKCIDRVDLEKVRRGAIKLHVSYKPNVAGTMENQTYVVYSMKHLVFQLVDGVEKPIILKGYDFKRVNAANTDGLLTVEQAKQEMQRMVEEHKQKAA